MATIHILGVGNDGFAGLTSRSRALLDEAEVVLGSDAVLTSLPDVKAERFRVGTDLAEAVEFIRDNMTRRLVVVASGDPLFYGFARYLFERIGEDAFEVVPHVSTMQLAFARIKESWEEAYLTDLSTRPFESALDHIRTAETVGLFTNDDYTPTRVARELLARGIDYFRAFVCENLGAPDERITQGDLAEIERMEFDPLNVLILRRKPGVPDKPRGSERLARFGNPDDVFAQSQPKTGLITQAEVRAVALSKLDLYPGRVMWDVGAGSGSVALEAAQLVEPGMVYAIEQDAADYHLIVANAQNFGIKNVKAIHGTAPAVFHDLPAPDAIFIGGNGGEVARLLESAYAALRPGGQIAANVATLEMLTATYEILKRLGGSVEVLLLNISRSVEQLEALRFEAVNPTFLLRSAKPTE